MSELSKRQRQLQSLVECIVGLQKSVNAVHNDLFSHQQDAQHREKCLVEMNVSMDKFLKEIHEDKSVL